MPSRLRETKGLWGRECEEFGFPRRSRLFFHSPSFALIFNWNMATSVNLNVAIKAVKLCRVYILRLNIVFELCMCWWQGITSWKWGTSIQHGFHVIVRCVISETRKQHLKTDLPSSHNSFSLLNNELDNVVRRVNVFCRTGSKTRLETVTGRNSVGVSTRPRLSAVMPFT